MSYITRSPTRCAGCQALQGRAHFSGCRYAGLCAESVLAGVSA